MGTYVYTVEQMQALENAADAAGHSYDEMMEQAAAAVTHVIEEMWPAEETRVLVLAGPGNNGGDGLVAARNLARLGFSVAALLWKRDRDEQRAGEARDAGVSLLSTDDEEGRQTLKRALRRADVIIDALLGTGVSRPIEGELAEILVNVRDVCTQAPVDRDVIWTQEHAALSLDDERPALVAVDVPSGLHSDSGDVDPATVPADVTVTLAGPKRGMLIPDGWDVLGELVVGDIGIPDEVVEEAEKAGELLTPATVASLLPKRPLSGHKGTFGKTLVVGGSANYVGAPALAAEGAGRAGAGLVTLAVPEIVAAVLTAKSELTSMTWLMLPHDLGAIRTEALKVLSKELDTYDSLVVGMGIGQEEITQEFVYGLLGLHSSEQPRKAIGFLHGSSEAGIDTDERLPLPPTVLDADALNALAAYKGSLSGQLDAGHFVFTPHPGEMSRLSRVDLPEVQQRRLELTGEKAQEWQQVIVLKGAFTVIAAPDGRVSVSPFANPVLATAGTGDVLAGVIGGLLAQGLKPYDAARLGVYAHGLAGTLLARNSASNRGALSSELAPYVRDALAALA